MDQAQDRVFVRRALEAAIRIGIIALLGAWCFEIVRPFVVPVVWGIIIAVAVFPAYLPIERALGGRRAMAAIVATLVMLAVLLVPTVMLAGTLVDGAEHVAGKLIDGSLSVPPPPPGVADWPLIGEPLEAFWKLASNDLARALQQIRPQLASGGRILLSTTADAGIGLLQFMLAIVIAGVLMAHAHDGDEVAHAFAQRLAGDRGPELAELGQATVRGVARGILGVALIQSLLAGLGFLAVGLPGAGLLAVLCLLLAIVQIGPGLVLIGAAIYVFSTAPTLIAVVFAVWCAFVALIDNVLKPILLGRGAKVPMVVVFIGAIGGFLATGIIGLFVGSVVLSLGYTLLCAWLKDTPPIAKDA
ncbi:MAG: AI-2E family transporter [Rhodospirillales bacterium]|nr:AI-2E family transporter [Rhodospirillales bacterium]